MIELKNVFKKYPVQHGQRVVLHDISLTIRRHEKLGILGRNGSGKSTLVRILGGTEPPSSGEIHRSMTVSWPLALAGGFQGSLTGLDNLRFICRVYDTTYEDKVAFIQEFSELGNYLREPIRTYSNGMRARLAFAISMVVEFDCYLIDEVTSVGDRRFHEKCRIELFEKRKDRAMVLVTHDPHLIQQHCNTVGVLIDGKYHEFSNIEEGFRFYDNSMKIR